MSNVYPSHSLRPRTVHRVYSPSGPLTEQTTLTANVGRIRANRADAKDSDIDTLKGEEEAKHSGLGSSTLYTIHHTKGYSLRPLFAASYTQYTALRSLFAYEIPYRSMINHISN